MPRLQKDRHESFAQAIALGLSAAEAARKCGYSVRAAASTGWHLSRSPLVAQRIAELKSENRQSAAPLIHRDDLIEFLVNVVRMPVKKRDLKASDQLKAAELLSRMMGWNEPEKHDVNIGLQSELVAVIAKLRGRKSVHALAIESESQTVSEDVE